MRIKFRKRKKEIRSNTAVIESRDFLIGIEEIDAQHMQFINLMNRLSVEIMCSTPSEKTFYERLLLEIEKFTEFHFVSEENMMLSESFPELEKHQKIHKELLIELKQRFKLIKDGKSKGFDIIVFLKDWFFSHTKSHDKKFGSFVKKD